MLAYPTNFPLTNGLAQIPNNRSKATNKTLLLCLFALSFAAGIGYIQVFCKEGQIATSLFYSFTLVFGVKTIFMLSRAVNDSRIKYLAYIFLIKMIILLFLLHFAWEPLLNPHALYYGYDPQRYYFQAEMLARNHFNMKNLDINLNYPGILYYWGFFFNIFGHNTVVPLIVNSLTTEIACILIVFTGYHIRPFPKKHDWMLGLFMVIPEVLYFDTISARESAMMGLLIISILGVFLFFSKLLKKNKMLSYGLMALSIVSSFLVLFIRTPMILPIITSQSMLLLVSRNVKPSLIKTVFSVIVIILLFSVFQGLLRKSGFDYTDRIMRTQRMELGNEWTENSIGKKFVPKNNLEYAFFAPFRFAIYIAAPLPTIDIRVKELFLGYFFAWEILLDTISAFIYVVLFPFAMVSIYYIMRFGKRNWAVFAIPFLFSFASIAFGNDIIHPRYRLMAIPFLWGAIWLGRFCKFKLIEKSFAGWYFVICAGIVTYFGMKGF